MVWLWCPKIINRHQTSAMLVAQKSAPEATQERESAMQREEQAALKQQEQELEAQRLSDAQAMLLEEQAAFRQEQAELRQEREMLAKQHREAQRQRAAQVEEEEQAGDDMPNPPKAGRKHSRTRKADPFYDNGIALIDNFIDTHIRIATEPDSGAFVPCCVLLDAFFKTQNQAREEAIDTAKKRFFHIKFKAGMTRKHDAGWEIGWKRIQKPLQGYKGVILLHL